MKNNSKSISSFGKKLSKSQLLAKLAKKNLKGGSGCPPPVGNKLGCPPPVGN